MDVAYRNPAYESEYDFAPAAGAPFRTVLVATTPRSGSSLFGFLSRQTRGCGFPLEYFTPVNRALIERRLGITGTPMPDYVRALHGIRTSAAGTFAYKLHWSDVADFAAHGGWAAAAPTHVLLLERRARLDQAISLHIASHTNEWIALNGYAMTRTAEPRYDRAMIASALAALERQHLCWEELLRDLPCPVLRVAYEDVLADCPGVFARLAEFLGVPSEVPDLARVELARQGSVLNRDWRDRFANGR